MNKKNMMSMWFFLLTCFYFQPVMAAGEVEYILEKRVTSITPVFMIGHLGDPNWIEGFLFEGDIFLEGGETPIGTFTGEATLFNPPLNQAEVYDAAFIVILNVLPGIGTFRTTGSGVGLGSSTDDTGISWAASISDGTGALINSYGLSVGNGVVKPFAGQGTLTEVVNIRTGF